MSTTSHRTDGDSRLWHPFADMASVPGSELVFDRAEDCWIWDEDGNRYLDATASLWCCNLGHGEPRIQAAIREQLERLDSYSIFGDYANRPAMDLADRLAAVAPMDDARVFLTSGGGDSIDTAAKIARAHWIGQGVQERTHIIGRTQGYHGTHAFGTSIGGIESNTSGWGQLVPETSSVPWDSLEALEAEILRIGPERVAAFFCEPVIGAGGVLLPPEGYLEGVSALCEEHGILLVIDAVICGFGRLGNWFGIERWGVRPDMVVFAKGVSAGVLPVGGVAVAGHVAEPFFGSRAGSMLRHGPTYAGHPVCCAAALAALDVYETGLLERGKQLEAPLAAQLDPLASHSAVGAVRSGIGLLGAVDLHDDVLAAVPGAVGVLQRAAREHGVLVRGLPKGVAVSPPLTIDDEQLQMIGTGLRAALDTITAGVR
ncbi:MAG: aminotransferase class III-fold pyridoxal phosphate-dependent enzyme [Patulibacter sp.]